VCSSLSIQQRTTHTLSPFKPQTAAQNETLRKITQTERSWTHRPSCRRPRWNNPLRSHTHSHTHRKLDSWGKRHLFINAVCETSSVEECKATDRVFGRHRWGHTARWAARKVCSAEYLQWRSPWSPEAPHNPQLITQTVNQSIRAVQGHPPPWMGKHRVR